MRHAPLVRVYFSLCNCGDAGQFIGQVGQRILLSKTFQIDDNVQNPLMSHFTAFAYLVNKSLTNYVYHLPGRHITGGFDTPRNSGSKNEQAFETKEGHNQNWSRPSGWYNL